MPVETLTTIFTPDLDKSHMFDFETFIKTELGLDLNKEFKKEGMYCALSACAYSLHRHGSFRTTLTHKPKNVAQMPFLS